VYKFRAHTPEATRIHLVRTLILPIFDYGDLVCCNLNGEGINRLQVAQNNAIRYIFNVKRWDHATKYYIKTNILKIKERRDLHCLMFTHKTLNGMALNILMILCLF
jgi:hypothetical protein